MLTRCDNASTRTCGLRLIRASIVGATRVNKIVSIDCGKLVTYKVKCQIKFDTNENNPKLR